MSVGLVAVGGYVPRYRLTGQVAAAVWGSGGGERAVAGYDEDALTMAGEAALNALGPRDPARIGACFFASTSAPYVEKSSATLLASVTDLPAEVITADLGGSLRCGTTALRLALDTVRAGSVGEALVAAADLRPTPPGSDLELMLGDGAGAVLVGTQGLIATFEGAFTVSHEFTDVWRNDGDRYLHALPDAAFVRAHGLDKHLAEAVAGLLRQTGRKPEDIATLVLYAPDARTHQALVRQLGFPASAIPREPVIGRAGNTGSAACLLGLAAALEEVKPRDQILVVSYGNGAEALLFEATDAVAGFRPVRPVTAQLAAGRPLTHYGKLLRFRRHVETEVPRAFTSVPTLVREERQNFRLYGQKCEECGAVSYPRRHLCWQCSSSRLADYRLAKQGRVFTFTKDHLVPNPDPPTVMVAADLDGGGRFYAQLTDCDPATVTFDMEVELTFRRLHEGDDYVNYFWKFRPVLSRRGS
ncbi:MAG: OB-fold domain-containing protein [Candidatus Rokubacteria bacterium]|nr:OB-fold domain-containing protein [Candidatus Rokubacteria bacterium]